MANEEMTTEVAAPEVAVIGAGLAGLTAAVHLAERGVPVVVLEADSLCAGGRLWGGPRAGGEVSLDGFTFYPEHGLHGIWNEYRNLSATLERFGIVPEIALAEEEEWIHGEAGRVRRVEIGSVIRGASLPAPLHYLELFTKPGFLALLGPREWLSLFNVWGGLLLAVALDPFARNIPLQDQTLADFFKGWSPRVAALFLGLARNSLAASLHDIPLASFIAFLRFYTLMRRDAWRFTYLRTDPGDALINPLVERLEARGGRLLLGAWADQISPSQPPSDIRADEAVNEKGAGGWQVRFQTRLGPRTFQAAHIILAVEAPAAQSLLRASPATQAIASTLTWPAGQPSAVVRLWFDSRPRPGPEAGIFTGDFAVDNFFWLHRLQTDFIEWALATGGSAVELHCYGPDAFLNQPDAVIIARALTDLYRAYPEMRGHRLTHSLQRNAATHSRLIVDVPERWLGVQTPWPNLWACGDWVRGEWPALFMERACVSGVEAANRVLSGIGQEPFPIATYSEPEWLARQLQRWMLGGRAFLRRWQGRSVAEMG